MTECEFLVLIEARRREPVSPRAIATGLRLAVGQVENALTTLARHGLVFRSHADDPYVLTVEGRTTADSFVVGVIASALERHKAAKIAKAAKVNGASHA